MKYLILLFLTLSIACTKSSKDERVFSDDYVLIEFAAKLEEDYHKMKKKEPTPPDYHNSQD